MLRIKAKKQLPPLSDKVVHDRLLKSIRRTIRKSGISADEKIKIIVSLIVETGGVDVCSCYVARPGDVLELYATKGLDERATHETFLRVGEGLVGEIALKRKPQAFEDIWNHASFVYKPETGEKAFQSLAGVPIMQDNVLLGVLCVQTVESITYPATFLELLSVIAMALSGIVAAIATGSVEKKMIGGQQHRKFEATKIIAGIALGRAYVHKRVALGKVLASSTSRETKRLESAIKTVETEINHLVSKPNMSDEQKGILETYLMFMRDKGWQNKMIKSIGEGLTAEAAVQRVCGEIAERMRLMTDTYIKERIHDFQDLSNRLMRHLRGEQIVSTGKLPKNTVLVAKSLGPAELLDYDITRIKAIVLEEGSQTMHVVIVARSFNIPVVAGIHNISEIVQNDDVLGVDADNGFLYVNPSDEVLDDFETKIKVQRRLQTRLAQLSELPAVTTDGVEISLNINAGLSSDLINAKASLFDGIGLYRTELPFMSSEQLPDIHEQTQIYRRVIQEMKDKPVVFRTLDIGSDKVLPYFENRGEKNPAMGWRSIRITLDRRAILRGQLRAFIRASAQRELSIMFPMIANVDEFRQAKQTLDFELAREKEKGNALPKAVKVGTMLEVPSLLFQLEELVKEVDFISIGTNDLAQFLFATDRSNPIIWTRYDTLSPAFLKMLRYVHEVCAKANVPCSICGEMASRPLECVALIGLGYKKLSMNPSALGMVKAVVRSMNQKQTESFLMRHLSDTVETLRPLLQSYAIDHDIFI